MKYRSILYSNVITFLVIVAAYVLCHGLTFFVITPLQKEVLSEITVFASLVYLPHGVRVLAVWIYRWRAFLPLLIGNALSHAIFEPIAIREMMAPVIAYSVTVSALSPILAFECFRLLGINLYSGGEKKVNWKWLLIVGALASVFNSIGQSIVFSGLILPELGVPVLLAYASGDLIGLFVSIFILMLAFRWIRMQGEHW